MLRSSPESVVVVDLFAGAGGLSAGLTEAGLKVAAAVEIHPDAASTYSHNHPGTAVFVRDIRSVGASELRAAVRDVSSRRRGAPDVVAGGPPCQGFSFAGDKRVDDPRNALIDAFIDMCAALKPPVAVMENVPGLVQMRRYRGWRIDQILRRFREAGFANVEWNILAAEEFGVPQQRKRLFVVATRRGVRFEWPEPTHGQSLLAEKPFVTVEDAISDLDFLESGESADEYVLPPRTDYQVAMREGASKLFNHEATRHSDRVIERFAFIPEGGGVEAIPVQLRTKKEGLLRLARQGLSRAIVSAPEDLIHYRAHRIPTVRETARLQSFPDSFVFLGQRTSGNQNRKTRYCSQTQQVGNAVPPRLAAAMGRQVEAALGRVAA